MSNRKRLADNSMGSAVGQPTRHEAAKLVRAAAEAFLAGELHTFIQNHNHTIDEHGKAVLKRLSDSNRNSDPLTAAEAIAEALPQTAWEGLFADCIIAEHKARNHQKWIKDSQIALERHTEAKKALNIIRRYLNLPSRDSLSRNDPLNEAMATVACGISLKRRAASLHLGLVSRKHDENASRTEGVAWIRDSLKAACERTGRMAQPRHVAAIASAALNMGEVTIDAARKAVSSRKRLVEYLHGAGGAFEG